MEAIIAQIQGTSMVEWLGTATGLAGVYLSIKEKVLAWPCFLLCYGLYAYLSYSAALYAAMTLNACFIPFSLYGWWKWGRSPQGKNGDSLAIASMAPTQRLVCGGVALFATLGIGALLSRYTEGAYPYLDAFATALSICAQWMLGRKYIENWIAWLIADMAFIVLWGIQGYWVAVGMFLVFTVLATLGFLSWRKELARNAN